MRICEILKWTGVEEGQNDVGGGGLGGGPTERASEKSAEKKPKNSGGGERGAETTDRLSTHLVTLEKRCTNAGAAKKTVEKRATRQGLQP